MADTGLEVRVSKPFDRYGRCQPLTREREGNRHSKWLKNRGFGGLPALPALSLQRADESLSPGGASLEGIRVEISQGGMSAMIQGPLKPGEVVLLQPVTDVVTGAVVRHNLGLLYGFEFLELAREQAAKIASRCRKGEPWRSNARSV